MASNQKFTSVPQFQKKHKGIIRSCKSNEKQQWDILYYYSSKKKARENNVTSCDVTYGHMTDVISGRTPYPNYDGLQVHHHI